eukprot:TCALIF_04340-PA protein Name:"Similar to porin Voltage-dependent anion-selective channel (Drosophila melanogaster)" AED:0.12 eAED:0.17 QI:46/0.33/0.5/1/0/0/4/148/251
MSPPVFGDLGKGCRDVFGKGFHFGLMKLDVKTKTDTGETGKMTGQLETKYRFKEHGITVTEKWNTDNNLFATVDLQNASMKGLKLTLDSSFSPATGSKNGKIKAEYKHDTLAAQADMDMNMGGPLVNASLVLGHQGWLAGYQMAFDSTKSKITRNNIGLGYAKGDFVFHSNVNDGQVFSGSVYQRVNPALETGVQLGWTSSNNATQFGIGCKYNLDRDASIRITITLSTLIDGKNFNQGGHKLGVALEVSA